MPELKDFTERVIKALDARIPDSKCPLCNQSAWAVQYETVTFNLQIKTGYTSSSGRGLPCAALVCQVCGNVQFINLNVLDPTIVRDFT
jgi:hypothetical protein